MGERVCIMMYEGGCAFVQTLNVTDALWVDGERMCVSKATLWVKAQHEGALPPPCIVRKDPRVPHTARRGP